MIFDDAYDNCRSSLDHAKTFSRMKSRKPDRPLKNYCVLMYVRKPIYVEVKRTEWKTLKFSPDDEPANSCDTVFRKQNTT